MSQRIKKEIKSRLFVETADIGMIQNPLRGFYYCKLGNFRVTFISRIFYFRIFSEFLNSRTSVHVFYKVYSDSLLARTLNSRGNQFANISEN